MVDDNTPWVVGRENGCCYVEHCQPLHIGGTDCGEIVFDNEQQAVRFAVNCEEDLRDTINRNLRDLRARLRRLEKEQQNV